MNLQVKITIEEFYWFDINFSCNNVSTKLWLKFVVFFLLCLPFSIIKKNASQMSSLMISYIQNLKIFLGEHAPRYVTGPGMEQQLAMPLLTLHS